MSIRYADQTGAFEVESYPGQPQIAHCHAFFIRPHLRGMGLGKSLKRMQTTLLEAHNYNYATCTVLESNMTQKKILLGEGWKHLDSFFDSRQNAQVELWGYSVKVTK